MSTTNVELVYEELCSTQPDVQLRVLSELQKNEGELQQILNNGDAVLLVTLIELLKEHGHGNERGVAEKIVAMEVWHVLVALVDLISPGDALVSRLVSEFGLLECTLFALTPQDGNPAFISVGLSCILSLKRHNIKLLSISNRITQAAASLLETSCEGISLTPLFQVLRALGAESVECGKDIQRIVEARMCNGSSDFRYLVLKSMLECYDPTTKVRKIYWEACERWELESCLDLLIHVLRQGLSFEKFTVLKCLRFEASEDFTSDFLAQNGISVLASIISTEGPEVHAEAVKCVEEMAKLNFSYCAQIVQYQVENEEVEILPATFYIRWFTITSASTDFESLKQQMFSESDEAQRQVFTFLPKDIEVLAPFCIDYGLIPVLTQLLLGEATSGYIRGEVWELLVHIIYELPRIGICKLRESCDLAALALRFTSLEYSPALRKQAIVYLSAPLNKSRSIRERLVNDEGAIPILVDLLSREEDSDIANLLSNFLRDLLTGGRNYSAELDLVVRGILDNEQRAQSSNNSKTKRYYLNLLSLYRKTGSGALGHEANDDTESLQLTVTALENGSEVEKLLVLKHFRKFAASWGLIHLGILRENILAIACVIIHEPAELKQIAVEVLNILAELDKGCRDKVMAAQAQFWPDDPIFNFSAVDHGDAGEEVDGDEVEYEYSDDEMDVDDLADADRTYLE